VPGYRSLRLDGSRLHKGAGVELDLGATAKAAAADRAAALVHGALGTGVLVSLGGDIATAGAAPGSGWQVHVQDRDEDPWTQVELPAGSAIATSSTVSRQWRRAAAPCTTSSTPAPASRPARSGAASPWPPSTCLHANAVTTAALVRGERPSTGYAASACRPGSCAPTASSCTPTAGRQEKRHEPRERAVVPRPRHRLVALVMFTLTMVLGITTRSGAQALGLSRFGVADLHKTASLTGTGLVAVHVGTPAVRPLRAAEAGRPRLPVPRGVPAAVAGPRHPRVDVLVLIVASSLLRHRIGPRAFKALHWSAYALWPVAFLHALGTGTDAGTVWFRAIASAAPSRSARRRLAHVAVLRRAWLPRVPRRQPQKAVTR
jgi:hypothetical protein